jgi:hypothetical protein
MTGRRSHGTRSALNGVVHQGTESTVLRPRLRERGGPTGHAQRPSPDWRGFGNLCTVERGRTGDGD